MRIILFTILLISFQNTFSQDLIAIRLDSINALIKEISENENNVNLYNHLYTDGQILTKKKILGIFGHSISKGGFAETYLLKDTLLVCLTIGSREYLNKNKNQSTNKVLRYIYDNERLCYYSEIKKMEYKGITDSLIYQIVYYIDENQSLIKASKIGTFNLDEKKHCRQIIINSKDKIKDKKIMIR